jgi:DUF4097 and DUF4098 domain-containing protein YvlB
MNSEEKLNHLFEALKAEKASTSVADVTSWIQASAQVTAPKSTSKIIIQKNFFIMSTIVTTLIVGGFLFLSGNKESKSTPPQNNTTKEAILDTSTSVLKQDNQIPVNKEFSENPFIQPLIDLGIEPLPFMEMDNGPAITQLDPIHSTQHSPRTNNQTNAGSWLSSNDSLFVDTLFSGVNKVVFRGSYNDKIMIEGSKRQDISFNYNFENKTKGLIKKKSKSEVTYEIKDSVLTIRSMKSGNDIVVIGVMYTKEFVTFKIPDHIPIDIQTDYGDISANSLNGSSVQLNTSYGDLDAKKCSGSIALKSDYGDLTLTELNGKIDAHTDYGDVKGEKIMAKEHCILRTDYGDVDAHLLNPIQDITLELKTDFGSVISKREDFSVEGKQFNIGAGSNKISLKTNFGDVIIR